MVDEFVPGHVIPGTSYRMVRELGKGAMGAVHEVKDITVDAPYVMKTLLPNLVENRNAIALMRTEARVLANLQHENIVRVFTAGVTTGGVPFFIMDRLTGSTLQGYLKTRGISPPVLTIIDLVVQMLRGLEHAHERGIVHRDIKPENIFLHLVGLETRVKLLDFGILKLVEDGQVAQDAQAKRRFMGTPMWASPEQIACRGIGPKTDLYSIGLILYYMLSGRLPFRHRSMAEYASWARSIAEPPSIEQFVPDLHPALRDVVMAALEPDPEFRPRDASAFAAELLRVRKFIDGNQNWNLTGATFDLAIRDVYDASGKTMAPAEPAPLLSTAEMARARLGVAVTAPAPPPSKAKSVAAVSLPDATTPGPTPESELPAVAPHRMLEALLTHVDEGAAQPPPPYPSVENRTGPTPQTIGQSSMLSQGGIAHSLGPETTSAPNWAWYAKATGMAIALGLLVAATTTAAYLKFVLPGPAPAAIPAQAASIPAAPATPSPSEPTVMPTVTSTDSAPPPSRAAATTTGAAPPAPDPRGATATSSALPPSRPRGRHAPDAASSKPATESPGSPSSSTPPSPRFTDSPPASPNVGLLGESWEPPARRDAGAR